MRQYQGTPDKPSLCYTVGTEAKRKRTIKERRVWVWCIVQIC
jgi:hypothetical protein